VTDIAGNARNRLVGQATQPWDHRRRAGGEIVDDQRAVARTGKLDDDVRADVSRAAGDQNGISHGVMLRERPRAPEKKPGALSPVDCLEHISLGRSLGAFFVFRGLRFFGALCLSWRLGDLRWLGGLRWLSGLRGFRAFAGRGFRACAIVVLLST